MGDASTPAFVPQAHTASTSSSPQDDGHEGGGGEGVSDVNSTARPSRRTGASLSRPPAYYPSFLTPNGLTGEQQQLLSEVDWQAEFDKVVELTEELIEQQLVGDLPAGRLAPQQQFSTQSNTAHTSASNTAATSPSAHPATPPQAVAPPTPPAAAAGPAAASASTNSTAWSTKLRAAVSSSTASTAPPPSTPPVLPALGSGVGSGDKRGKKASATGVGKATSAATAVQPPPAPVSSSSKVPSPAKTKMASNTPGAAAAAARMTPPAASVGNGGGGGGAAPHGATATAVASLLRHMEMNAEDDDDGLPPLTANGNRRWKKQTKAQRRRELAQKGAFEAFASALLHSVSPFMAPLRAKCGTSLPHIKVDQRFGKNGQPQSAIAQFIVAPLVTNYRPRHFHDISPGDIMEFDHDLALVLRSMSSAYAIIVGYGPVWKRYAVPYCYIACREYRKEVLALCPDEVPNSRSEAVYEDDIVKDITSVILAVEELEQLQEMSIVEAMTRRVNLAPMYDAFDTIFHPLENYQIEIVDIHKRPSTFLLKTSQLELEEKPHPITIADDPELWDELPVVSRVVVQGSASVAAASDGSGAAAVAAGVAGAGSSPSSHPPSPQPAPSVLHGRATEGGAAASAQSAKVGGADGDAFGKGKMSSPGPSATTTTAAAKGEKARTSPGGVAWHVAVPIALSVGCVAATAAIVLGRRRK